MKKTNINDQLAKDPVLPLFFGVWGIYAAEMIANPVTTVITFIVFERYMKQLGERLNNGQLSIELRYPVNKSRGLWPRLLQQEKRRKNEKDEVSDLPIVYPPIIKIKSE